MKDNIIVRIMQFPDCVEGVTVPSPDGTYNIYVNSIFSHEKQMQIIDHELRHVTNSDFTNFDSIKIIEDRAAM